MSYLFLKDIFPSKLKLYHQVWLDVISEAVDADLITEYNHSEMIRPYDESNFVVVKGMLLMWTNELSIMVVERSLTQTSRPDNLNIGFVSKKILESDTTQFGVKVVPQTDGGVEFRFIGLNGGFEPVSVYFDPKQMGDVKLTKSKILLTKELLYLELNKLIANEFLKVRKLQDQVYYGPKKDLTALMDKFQDTLHENYHCGVDRNDHDDVESDGLNINPDPTNLIFTQDLVTSFVLHWCIQGSDVVSGKFFLPQ